MGGAEDASRIGYGAVGGKTAYRGISKNSWTEEDEKCKDEDHRTLSTFDPILNKMPAPTDRAAGSKKRKQVKESGVPSSKRRAVAGNEGEDAMAKVLELEEQISESRKYYNNIATLISMLGVGESSVKPNLAVAVSLCRVFSRLIVGGNLTDTNRAAENEKIIVAWLKERCSEYQKAMITVMREGDASSQVRISSVYISHLSFSDKSRLRPSPYACALSMNVRHISPVPISKFGRPDCSKMFLRPSWRLVTDRHCSPSFSRSSQRHTKT